MASYSFSYIKFPPILLSSFLKAANYITANNLQLLFMTDIKLNPLSNNSLNFSVGKGHNIIDLKSPIFNLFSQLSSTEVLAILLLISYKILI